MPARPGLGRISGAARADAAWAPPAEATKAAQRAGIVSIGPRRDRYCPKSRYNAALRRLANKMARTAWASMVHGGTYRAPELAEAA
jgi:hypothetical protein